MDAVFLVEPGVNSTVLWLRHRSLSIDGCGHYLQTRAGTHGGNGGRGDGVFWASGLKQFAVSYQQWRSSGGGAGGGDCVIFVPTDSGMDSRAARSFLLSGPAGLPAHADRIWQDADQRSAARPDAEFGDGSRLADIVGGSAGHFCRGRGSSGADAAGAVDGRARQW